MALRGFALFAVSLCVVLLLISGIAFAAKVYPDRAGDVAGGPGPDIASIAVSNTATVITFHVLFAKAPPLGISLKGKWVDMLLVGIDVPPLGPKPVSPGGEWPGADFALGTHGPSKTGQVVRLKGKGTRRVASFKVVTIGRTMTFAVPRRVFGSPAWFTFNVAAAREADNEAAGSGVDLLPDRGTSRYTLTR